MHDALDLMLESGRDKVLVAADESGDGEAFGAIRLDDLMAAIADEPPHDPAAQIDPSAGS